MGRLGRFLLIGVVVLISLGLPAPVATGAATSAAAPVTLTLTAGPGGSVAADAPGPTYEAGAIVTLTATPAAGNLFVGWFLDGTPAGWATPRKLVMDADHAVDAAFAPATAFTDLPGNAGEAAAIRQISARGVIKGYTPAGCAAKGLAVPCFGSADTVLRGEIAVMIVRAMGWGNDDPADDMPFVDVGDMDPEIQRAIAILAARGVMAGYGNRLAGPTDPVLRIQIISLITRGLVRAGLWTAATANDPTIYPNIPASSPHRLDLVTFVQNAGPIPDRPQNQNWDDWLSPAPRAWTARLLWQALDATFTGGPYNPSPTNRPPVAAADSYAAAANAPLTVAAPGVLANDSDPDGDALTAVLVAGPANGTLTLTANGGFTYTPAAGFIGADSFTYQARDPSGATSAVTTATIAVTAGDPASTVTGTTPASGATGVPGGAAITVTFSEAVNATAASFQLACPTGTPQTFTLSAAPATSYTLTPTAPLPAGVTCTVTVLASAVTDTDADDPPDQMAANHVFSFTIDAAPTVTSTTPANGATNLTPGANISVTFSEPVTVTGDWFEIVCTVSGTRTVADTAVTTADQTTFTIDPTADFASGDGCTVTIFAALVTDQDAADPPDTMAAPYVFSFGADVPPTVVSTTPADGATQVATNTSVTITFSEPVTVPSAAAFSIECPAGIPIGFTVTTPPAPPLSATSFTLTPSGALPEGVTCTVTVFAAQVTDVDTDDPPNTMAVDYVFTFATDAAPTVTSTAPTNGATVVPTGATVTVNFSEEVTATVASFTLTCTLGGPVTFTVSASPATSYTLTPSTPLPAGTTCTVTVVAAQVADTDSGDPPDTMAANYVFAFDTIVDAAPTVTATTPANNASAALNTDITVTFSEPVDVTGTWFTIACATSGPHTAAVSGGPTTFTLNPNTDFTAGEVCTVTIVAAQVTDQDTDEPPDAMAADYVFAFTADAAPTVTSTTPANGATGVATNTTIVVNFSEPVTATASSFTLACPVGTPVAFAVAGSGTATVTLTPSAPLPAGTLCTVMVVAAQVADTDGTPDPMAADFVFSFTTDAAPTVTTTTPANGATGVATSTAIAVNFSEAVTATAASFTLACPVGTPVAFTVAGSGTAAVTLTPSAPLPAGVVCTVTVLAAGISDVDTGDPPDNLAADYVFSFTTDAAPTVTSTTPANGATGVPVNTTIVVNFSEAVTATTASFAIACPVGTPVAFALSASPAASFTLTPSAPLPTGTVCTVTVVAAQVADTDGAPDQMAADFVFSFTTDAAPTVTSTTPTNGATGIAPSTVITVNFSEAVTATAASFAIACPTGTPVAFAVAGSGTATVTLTPTAPLPAGVLCTVTVLAAGISDVDTGDPPDNLVADYVFSFTLPPVAVNDTYTATIIGNVGVNTANSSGFSILANDVGAAPLTVTTSGTTANGGTVVVAASGTFTYTPAAGFEGNDSFTYTVTNTAGTSAPATVMLQTVSGVIWFVNANAGTNGDGRIGTPFNCLTGTGCFVAVAADEADDIIFLYESATTYAGPLTLLANQRLIGQDAGSPLATLAGLTAPADTIPLPAMSTAAPATTIGTAGLTLSASSVATPSANQLHGFTLSTPSGTAITGATFGTLTVSTVIVSATGGTALSLTTGALAGSFTSLTSTGGTNNILLSGVTSSANVGLGGGALSGASGASFSVVGGTVSTTYTGNITQTNNAALLSVSGGHITGTLTFQTGTLNATSGTGLQFDNADGTYNLDGVAAGSQLNGGDAGVDILGGSGGTFTFGVNLPITSPTGTAFFVGASAPTVTMRATITQIANRRGVHLENNTGGTFTFSGTLTLNTGTANAFEATATALAGTVVVQTATANVLSTAGGIALRINNVNIGAGGLTFRSISANGGANGIVLTNTGATAGLTVTGNGGTCTVATPTCTGGTIQNTTSDGIALDNTSNVSLAFTRVLNAGRQGIWGRTVTGFRLTNSLNIGAGDGDEENGILFENDATTSSVLHTGTALNGTFLIRDVVIDTPTQWGLRVHQNAGSLNLTIQRLTVQNNYPATFGEHAVSLNTEGSGTANVLVDDADFLTVNAGLHGNAQGAGGAVLNLTVQNTVINQSEALPFGINFTTGGSATGRLKATGNTLIGCTGTVPTNMCSLAIDLDASISSTLDATITGNTISNTGIGGGIEFIVNENATGRADIRNNTITLPGDRIGMNFLARTVVPGVNQTGALHLTLAGNAISGVNTAFLPAFAFAAGASGQANANTMCLNLDTPGAGNNTVNGTSAQNVYAYTFRQRTGTTFQIQGLTGSGTDRANVEGFINANHGGGTLAQSSGGDSASSPSYTDVFAPGGTAPGATIVNYTAGTCLTPTAPTLPPVVAVAPAPADTVVALGGAQPSAMPPGGVAADTLLRDSTVLPGWWREEEDYRG